MFNGEIIDRRKEKAAAEAATPAVLAEVPNIATGGKIEYDPSGPAPKFGTDNKVTEFKKTVRGEVQTFKSLGFTLVYLNLSQQPMLAGRCVGLRTDEKLFTADWLLPPVWEEGLVWQEEAKKRLLTFKGCSCSQSGRCAFHGEACAGQFGPGKWIEQDMERLRKVQTTPLCEALEVLMKAEAARQNAKIVAPGVRG